MKECLYIIIQKCDTNLTAEKFKCKDNKEHSD